MKRTKPQRCHIFTTIETTSLTYSFTFKTRETSLSLEQRELEGQRQTKYSDRSMKGTTTYSGSHSSGDPRDTLKDRARAMIKTSTNKTTAEMQQHTDTTSVVI